MLNLGPLVLIGIIAAIAYAVSRAARSHRPVGQDTRPGTRIGVASGSASRHDTGAAADQVSGAELGADLERWVDAGLLSDEQSLAILAYERSRAVVSAAVPAAGPDVGRPRRIPAVAEALGYLGGILATVGLVLVVARYWTDMPTAGRLILSASGALALLAAGAVVREEDDPALARLRGFLWLASSAAAALFAGVLTSDGLVTTKHETIVLACAGLVALQNGLLWRGRARPLQELAFLVSLVVAAGAAIAEVASAGPVGLTVWTIGVIVLAGGVKRRTSLPLLTESAGAVTVVVGSLITSSAWSAFGLVLAAASALALLALATVPGLLPDRADQRLTAIIGIVALLEAGPSAIGYFAHEAGGATGLAIWIIGAALLFISARRFVRWSVAVETFGGLALIGGAALTGLQWHGFAPIFGTITALGLVALGMLPGQVLLSVLGSIGLLINVPWTIGWFFPGEGRAPLLILISGALILAVAVLLTRERGRFRNELAPPRHSSLPPHHAHS